MITAKRSTIMSRVRSKDTMPELHVRQALRRIGIGYRLHVKSLPGSPDIVLTGRRRVIFVHGCYWHRHVGCARASTPRTNVEFWRAKFTANITRDARAVSQLEQLGWSVLVVWQCECRSDDLEARLRHFVTADPESANRSTEEGTEQG